jgi:hypothetical protein
MLMQARRQDFALGRFKLGTADLGARSTHMHRAGGGAGADRSSCCGSPGYNPRKIFEILHVKPCILVPLFTFFP